ncbi:hypothetical protein HY612_04780 [Candidatus Roizmanbacteria bacterium]|nr:hypothetical protein [Candidatus Roizmanbacteria bacterium]
MNQYIVGHRGAMGLVPENTLKAFKIGCESNIQVVECDIHLSKDKKIVVIHDNTLNRTTNGHGWVKDFTSSELKQLNAGDKEKIPSLKEVVDLVFAYKKKLIIEIKGESWEVVEETTNELNKFISQTSSIIPNIIIHSFWLEAVKKVKQMHPNVLTAIIMMVGLSSVKFIELIESAGANGASIAYDYISPSLINLAKTKKLFLDAWVLDYDETFNRMKTMGVNGLITNYPGRFNL